MRTFSLGLGLLSFALGFCGAISLADKPAISASADPASWTPEEETEVTREELAVTASSSALTEDSQSVTVTFASKKTEAYPNSSAIKNVYVTPIDPTFDIKTVTDEAKAAREEQGEAFVMPVYECTVFNVVYNPNGGSMKTTVVIPDELVYTNLIVFKVTSISSGVVFNEQGEVDYGGIEQIVIPKTITSIEASAFIEVPENVKIRCEAPEFYTNEQEEQHKTYPGEWTDATPIYDSELSTSEKNLLKRTAGGKREFGEGADFFLGMASEEFDLPLYVEYKLEALQQDGSYLPLDESYYEALPIQSQNESYDGVGSLLGVTSILTYVTVSIPSGHRIAADSLRFHNIYRAIPEENEQGVRTGRFVPNFEVGPLFARPLITYDYVPRFEDFFSMKENSIATLGNFLQFEVRLDRVPWETGYGLYPTLQPAMWNANEAAIRAGTLQIRYQLASLDQASYRFNMKDGSAIEYRIKTPIAYIHIGENGQSVGFMVNMDDIPGLRFENIASIQIFSFAIKVDLYKPSTNSIVTKSGYTVRFGTVSLFANAPASSHINMPLVITLTYIIYVIGFIALAVGYYFYCKRHYRNDEFRRVNKKRYLINSVKNFVGFVFVVSAVLFIVSRWALMRTTLVTYNPLDAFVAAFSVVALIFLGFTIKNLVVSFKNAKKRKEALRLKLDQDVVDDGTK